MKRPALILFGCLLCSIVAPAEVSESAAKLAEPSGGIRFREIHYDGLLSKDEARFTVEVEADLEAKGEHLAPLFQGDIALLPAKLPGRLKITRKGDSYFLVASRPGQFKFTLNLAVRVHRNEPWNEVSFIGPPATIASVYAGGERSRHGSAADEWHAVGFRQHK